MRPFIDKLTRTPTEVSFYADKLWGRNGGLRRAASSVLSTVEFMESRDSWVYVVQNTAESRHIPPK